MHMITYSSQAANLSSTHVHCGVDIYDMKSHSQSLFAAISFLQHADAAEYL
jgi:hypothetical protein